MLPLFNDAYIPCVKFHRTADGISRYPLTILRNVL